MRDIYSYIGMQHILDTIRKIKQHNEVEMFQKSKDAKTIPKQIVSRLHC